MIEYIPGQAQSWWDGRGTQNYGGQHHATHAGSCQHPQMDLKCHKKKVKSSELNCTIQHLPPPNTTMITNPLDNENLFFGFTSKLNDKIIWINLHVRLNTYPT